MTSQISRHLSGKFAQITKSRRPPTTSNIGAKRSYSEIESNPFDANNNNLFNLLGDKQGLPTNPFTNVVGNSSIGSPVSSVPSPTSIYTFMGKVGINTNTPQEHLTVNGNILLI
jgi:hypothetical protein